MLEYACIIKASESKTLINNLQKEGVYEWFKETSDLAQAEAMEDEWKQTPLESDICNTEPETGAGTTIMERSLCPWQWRVNREEDREPKEILEAYCLCSKSRGNSVSLCSPIMREVAVLKKIICDPGTQHYEYVRAVQTITVGCHSVLPHIELASPFRFFKNPYGQEI
uniref:Interleukin-17 n=1 Tax=Syphacia muris TaxID=451379 RepID=A0A0N5AMB7_9BILA